MSRIVALFFFLSNILNGLQVATEQTRTDTNAARFEKMWTAQQLPKVRESDYKYVRENIARADVWKTLEQFQTTNKVQIDPKAAMALSTEYLVAEHYQIVHSEQSAESAERVKNGGQRAFKDFLQATMKDDEVDTVDVLFARELGKEAMSVPERNRYGRISVDSVPRGASITLDDEADVIASTAATIIVLTGKHRVHCEETGLKQVVHEVDVAPNGLTTVMCSWKGHHSK